MHLACQNMPSSSMLSLTVALAIRTTQSWLILVTSGAHFITVLIRDKGSCTPLGNVFFASEGIKRAGVWRSVLESHSVLFEVTNILCTDLVAGDVAGLLVAILILWNENRRKPKRKMANKNGRASLQFSNSVEY